MGIIIKDIVTRFILDQLVKGIKDICRLLHNKLKAIFIVEPTFTEKLGENPKKRKITNICGNAIIIAIWFTFAIVSIVGLIAGFAAIRPYAVEWFSVDAVDNFLKNVKAAAIKAPFTFYSSMFLPIIIGYVKKKRELKISMMRYTLPELIALMATAFMGLFAIFLCMSSAAVMSNNSAEVIVYMTIAFVNLLLAVIVILIYPKLKEAA